MGGFQGIEANIPAIDSVPRSLIHCYPAIRPHKFIRKTGTWNQRRHTTRTWVEGGIIPNLRTTTSKQEPPSLSSSNSWIGYGSQERGRDGQSRSLQAYWSRTGVGESRSLQAYWSRALGSGTATRISMMGSLCSNDSSSRTCKVLHFARLDMGVSSCTTRLTSATG
jgi:hypothetical protein